MLTSQHLRVIKNAGRDLPAQAALVTVSGIHEYYEPEQLVDPTHPCRRKAVLAAGMPGTDKINSKCLFPVKAAVRERSVQRPFCGALSSGALPLPEFRIATNCCSCLRELTPSFS